MAMEHFDEKIVPLLKHNLNSSAAHSSYSMTGTENKGVLIMIVVQTNKMSHLCNLHRILFDGWHTYTSYIGSGEAAFGIQQDSQQNKTEQSICWMPQKDR